jgi:hypothetical protein
MRLTLTVGLAIALTLLFSPAAWARCTHHTYWINGERVSCMTCCSGNSCTTSCF